MMTKSRRRDPTKQVGHVNFPVDQIQSTGEGGMFVRLVVIDTEGDKDYMNRYIPCCGGYNYFYLDESFMGDDLFDPGVPPEGSEDYSAWYKAYTPKYKEMELRYFPNLNGLDEDPHRFLSRRFLAVLLLGATGWSSSWRCTYDDLTDAGKEFYQNVQKLYPGCELRLLTFLDT